MWPETKASDILQELSNIERMIREIEPGEWCDEECANALHVVADDARKARIVVQKKAGLPHDAIKPPTVR